MGNLLHPVVMFPGGGSPVPVTFCFPLFLHTQRKGADSERDDFPARGAQKNGHPQEAASGGCAALPVPGARLPPHV